MDRETFEKIDEILSKPVTENDSITFSELLKLLKELEPLVGDMKVKIARSVYTSYSKGFLNKDYRLREIIDITGDCENVVIGYCDN